jgi:hypothetical protein
VDWEESQSQVFKHNNRADSTALLACPLLLRAAACNLASEVHHNRWETTKKCIFVFLIHVLVDFLTVKFQADLKN